MLFEEGQRKEILMVMRGTYRNPVIKTKLASTIRKMGTSNLSVISCRIRIRELLQIKRKNNRKKSSEASVAEDEYSDGKLLVVSDDNSKPCKDWILDSGCTFHMCHNQD